MLPPCAPSAYGAGSGLPASEKKSASPVLSLPNSPITPWMSARTMNAANARSLVNWLGRFSLEEDGRMDLKMHGIMPIFSAARVLALRHALPDHSTAARLDALRGKPGVLEENIDGLLEAHQIILRAILQQQLADIEHGIPPSNRVDPKKLHAPEKAHLMWALKQVPLVRDLLGVPAS